MNHRINWTTEEVIEFAALHGYIVDSDFVNLCIDTVGSRTK